MAEPGGQEYRDKVQTPEMLARAKVMELWRPGNLFHNFSRYPRDPRAKPIDRLAAVLHKGLVPPALDPTGEVVSDLSLTVEGTARPYDSVVFLHQYGENSWLYRPQDPNTFCCFVDRTIPLLTQKDMEPDWPVLAQDEVYVAGIIPPERLTGIAVAPFVVRDVYGEFQREFTKLALPLYDFSGKVYWPVK
jgi:hypothetical protein